MLITQELSIETELPIFQVEGLAVEVRPNEHIKCKMYGILNTNDIKGLVYLNEEGTDISIKYKGVSIFRGVVGDIKINSVANIHNFELTAYSYSKKLDREKETKLFQDINKSYEELIKYSARKYAGNIIANIRDRKIEKPILCYKETAWEFIKRMTADLRTFIYPDTVTKSPNIWLGLREGENISKEDIILESIQLEKHNDNDGIIYAFKSYINYKIGDELKDSGKNLTVYEKKAEFNKGELIFYYLAADRKYLSKKAEPFENEEIIGLSLIGKVKKCENEKIYISFDTDDKKALYPFDWYPETGNGLYAMPEVGSRVELYVYGANKGEMYAIRCRDSNNDDKDISLLEVSKESKLSLSEMNITFQKEDILTAGDKHVSMIGARDLSINAEKKISLKARNIRLKSRDEMVFVSK